MPQRAFYSIDDDVLVEFNRVVPVRHRSKVVQRLMAQHVARAASSIERAARLIEADPSYREASEDADAMAIETLARLDDHESR
jgi:hypothetical protein